MYTVIFGESHTLRDVMTLWLFAPGVRARLSLPPRQVPRGQGARIRRPGKNQFFWHIKELCSRYCSNFQGVERRPCDEDQKRALLASQQQQRQQRQQQQQQQSGERRPAYPNDLEVNEQENRTIP